MSYIAFDLDAFDAAESAARHAGASADAMMAGLLRLWRYCWRQKTDQVTVDQLRGVFGMDAGPALVAFGFVAPIGNCFRVKGAGRYLRISAAQSEAGKKAKGNLKQYRKPAYPSGYPSGLPPAPPPAPLRLDPEPNTGSFSDERQANSDKRTANGSDARQKRAPAAKEPRTPDPRHAPLVRELERVFREETGEVYPFAAAGGRNAKAVATLLTVGLEPTILEAWRRALREPRFPKVRALWELAENFAHFVGSTGPPPKQREAPVEYAEGRVRL